MLHRYLVVWKVCNIYYLLLHKVICLHLFFAFFATYLYITAPYDIILIRQQYTFTTKITWIIMKLRINMKSYFDIYLNILVFKILHCIMRISVSSLLDLWLRSSVWESQFICVTVFLKYLHEILQVENFCYFWFFFCLFKSDFFSPSVLQNIFARYGIWVDGLFYSFIFNVFKKYYCKVNRFHVFNTYNSKNLTILNSLTSSISHQSFLFFFSFKIFSNTISICFVITGLMIH